MKRIVVFQFSCKTNNCLTVFLQDEWLCCKILQDNHSVSTAVFSPLSPQKVVAIMMWPFAVCCNV